MTEKLLSTRLPNIVVLGALVALIAIMLIIVFALSAGKTSIEAVQIAYQLGLIMTGLIGLPLAIWRSWTAHRQAATGEAQVRGLQKQIALAEAGAGADRLQKGAEMLQADGLAVRVAGIAILREMALNPDHRYRVESLAVLSSFARTRSNEAKVKLAKSPEDLVEAFTVLISTKLPEAISIGAISLRESHFDKVMPTDYKLTQCMFKDCTFYGANLSSRCGGRFEDCAFYNSKVDFDYVTLTIFEDCDFEECEFSGNVGNHELKKCRFSNIIEGGSLDTYNISEDLRKELVKI